MTSQVRELESQHIVQTYRRTPIVLVRGKGVRVYDEEGREYLDLLAGIGVGALGHGHEGLADAIAEQSREMIHCSNLFFHPLQGQVAERLAKLSGLSRAFFCNSGAEAVEACLKFARRYWHTKGAHGPHRNHRDGRRLPRPDDGRAVDDVGRALPHAVHAAAAERALRAGEQPGGAAGRGDREDRGDHPRADSGRRWRAAAYAGVRERRQ